MASDAESRIQFERVMDLMVEAGWLRSHIYTDGKGFHLVWMPLGWERAAVLNKIAETFHLHKADSAPVAFDILAHGGSFPPGLGATGKLQDEIATYWRAAIAELRLQRDEDNLITLLQITKAWGS